MVATSYLLLLLRLQLLNFITSVVPYIEYIEIISWPKGPAEPTVVATQVLSWITGARLFDSVLPSKPTLRLPARSVVLRMAPLGKRIPIPIPP